MKKMSGNTIVNIVAAALMLIALIVVEVSFQVAQGWFDTYSNPIIIVLAIVSIVLLLAIAAMNLKGIGGEGTVLSIVKTVFSVGACVCAGVIFGMVLGAIATEFAYTFLSDFNKGTVKESFMPAACTQAVVGMVICVVSMVAAAAANAFDTRKE